jgi:hypothetical protein
MAETPWQQDALEIKSEGNILDSYRETLDSKGEQAGVSDEQPSKTFTESLQLDSRYMDEFIGGNFVYLKPKEGVSRTAYDLMTVEHHETDPIDYFTMSREGITHFMKNESEFTSLDDWEREYYLFNQVTFEIP